MLLFSLVGGLAAAAAAYYGFGRTLSAAENLTGGRAIGIRIEHVFALTMGIGAACAGGAGALLAPLPEELYFRGALLDAFSRRGEVVGLWVAAVIFTAMQQETGIDIYLGIGGAPEGVLAAAALRCVGGQMQGRLILDTPAKWNVHAVWASKTQSANMIWPNSRPMM